MAECNYEVTKRMNIVHTARYAGVVSGMISEEPGHIFPL